MKKWMLSLFVLVLLIASINVAGDIYRYELYDWALSYEAEKAGLEDRRITIDGVTYFYLEGSNAQAEETIVMLHGFGGSKENWLRYARYFTDQYHVVVPDLAGHGENPQDMSEHYSTEDQVRFLKSLFQPLGIQRMHLIGNSMGGAISALYASMYPDEVLSLTLISPAGIHDAPSEMDVLLEQGQNPLIATNADDFSDLLNFVMEQPPYIPGPITKVEAEKAVNREPLNKLIFSHLRADLERGMEGRLASIKAPTLIIWGQQDRAISVKNIDRYAGLIPQAQTLVLEDIGHVAMIEVPEVSAEATLAFMANK